MSEFRSSITVRAPARDVFDFISDVSNLPKYLPTMQSAALQGPDRVHVHGDAGGHPYDADGDWNVDDDVMKITWGSDGENDYRGVLQVTDAGSDTCQVMGNLRFGDGPGASTGGTATPEDAQAGLEESLRSIKRLCEGSAG